MIRRTCYAHLAALAIAAVSLAANAAYITPWYVNPALKDRFWLGVDSFTPTGLAIGADATRLAIAAKPEGASDIIRPTRTTWSASTPQAARQRGSTLNPSGGPAAMRQRRAPSPPRRTPRPSPSIRRMHCGPTPRTRGARACS